MTYSEDVSEWYESSGRYYAHKRRGRAVSRLEEAEQRLRQLEKEIFQLKRFGRDRFEIGDVIRFTKTHNAADDTHKSYSYVAIKIGFYWYLTGQQRRERYTYDELIEFVVQYPAAENVQVATAWVHVTEAANEAVKFDAVDGPYPYTKTGEPDYEIVPLKKFQSEEDINH